MYSAEHIASSCNAVQRTRLVMTAALGAILLLAGAPPVAAGDAPEVCDQDLPASPPDAWLSDSIATPDDVDWFAFRVNLSESKAVITLGRLPAPAKLELYSSCGIPPLRTSDRPGRTYDEITTHLPVNKFFVKVTGVDGASSASSYRLRFRLLAATPATGGPHWVLSERSWPIAGGRIRIVGEVINASEGPATGIGVQVIYHYSDGHRVVRPMTPTIVNPVRVLGRSPFNITDAIPHAGGRRFIGYSLHPAHLGGCCSPVEGLYAGPLPRFHADGVHHYPGTIRNGHSFPVESPMGIVTLYDSLGRVLNARFAPAEASSLEPGEETTFDVTFPGGVSGVNRVVRTAQAWRVGTMPH